MEKFEERKAAYAAKLLENVDLVKEIIKDKEGEEKLRYSKILLTPSTELEIRFADALLQNAVDVKDYMLNVTFGFADACPIEENNGMKWLTDIIKQSLETNPQDLKIEEKSAEEAAELLFDICGALIGDPEETYKYMGTQLGYDMEDDEEQDKLITSLQDLNEVLNTIKQSKQPKIEEEELTEKSVSEFEAYSNKFHSLCENSKKLDSSSEILGALVELAKVLKLGE